MFIDNCEFCELKVLLLIFFFRYVKDKCVFLFDIVLLRIFLDKRGDDSLFFGYVILSLL